MTRIATLLLAILAGLAPLLPAQSPVPRLKARLLIRAGGHKTGDTVEVLGGQNSPIHPYHYLIKSKRDAKAWVSRSELVFLDTLAEFWQAGWFRESTADRIIEPDTYKKRMMELNQQSRKSIQYLQAKNLLFSDLYMEDYLLRLMLRIHPGPLYHHQPKAGLEATWQVFIRQGADLNIQIFYDGSLVVPLGWLIAQKSEAQAMETLAELMAHALLEHAQATYDPYKVNNLFSYSSRQKIIARRYAKAFMAQLPAAARPDTSQTAWFRMLSPLLQQRAWQDYHGKNWQKALKAVDQLITQGVATEETYFLKARLYRLLYDTEASNLTALGYLIRAEELGTHHLIEIPAERGLFFIRIGDYPAAKKAFEAYLKAQLTLDDNPEEQRWAREMIWRCVQQQRVE